MKYYSKLHIQIQFSTTEPLPNKKKSIIILRIFFSVVVTLQMVTPFRLLWKLALKQMVTSAIFVYKLERHCTTEMFPQILFILIKPLHIRSCFKNNVHNRRHAIESKHMAKAVYDKSAFVTM